MSPSVSRRSIGPAQPLVIPVAMRPGEGLADVMWRAAAVNGYHATKLVVQAAGVSGYCPVGGAASWAKGLEASLAATLGLPGGADEVRRLLYLPDETRKGWHDFFGTRIRLVYRSIHRRRVSPRALQVSPYSRAVWSIKPLCFDPATKEYLLDKCPECGREFGYFYTAGVTFCEFCPATDHEGFTRGRIDLRDYPQPLVDVDDVEALDFVTGLIDPDPEVRAGFRPALPECFRGYDRGSLFEFVVAIGCVMTADPGWRSELLPRPSFDADYGRFTPEVLAGAGRVVLDWPAGFHLLADRMRTVADERPGNYGLVKELGSLVGLTLDSHIEPGLRRLAREAIDSNMARTSATLETVRRKDNLFRDDLITVQQAAERFGVTRKFMAQVAKDPTIEAIRIDGLRRSPTLMSSALLDELFSQRAELLPATSVGAALYVPTPALASIAEAGMLACVADPLCLPPGQYFRKRRVDEMAAGLMSKLRADSLSDSRLSLIEAAFLLGSPASNPWASLVALVIEGRLPAWNRKAAGLANRVMLASADAVREAVAPRPWTDRDHGQTLTNLDVMLLLGIATPSNAVTLTRNGVLPKAPRLRDVQAFATKYMLTQELAKKLAARQVCSNLRAAASTLISQGVHPVTRLTHKTLSLLLWDRAQVEAFLHDRFAT